MRQCGFAAIRDVLSKEHEDRMESFVLSETLKYLYLLFDEGVPHIFLMLIQTTPCIPSIRTLSSQQKAIQSISPTSIKTLLSKIRVQLAKSPKSPPPSSLKFSPSQMPFTPSPQIPLSTEFLRHFWIPTAFVPLDLFWKYLSSMSWVNECRNLISYSHHHILYRRQKKEMQCSCRVFRLYERQKASRFPISAAYASALLNSETKS
jgi:hypothetical protein